MTRLSTIARSDISSAGPLFGFVGRITRGQVSQQSALPKVTTFWFRFSASLTKASPKSGADKEGTPNEEPKEPEEPGNSKLQEKA